MKRFYCDCGAQIYFDSSRCVKCGNALGFDHRTLSMRSLRADGEGKYIGADEQRFRICDNGVQFSVCNWLVPDEDSHPLCFACRFNRTIPNLALPGNIERWRILEEAKKRLFYSLLTFKVPLVDGWRDGKNGLLMDFIEDGRSHGLYAETFVSTGYLGGIITVNTLEADDSAREAVREQLNESYRTVLGHMRHESGHYYWARLNADEQMLAEFRALFGDETADYQQALSDYYEAGPGEWQDKYISAYASVHPVEDWAETWGHYLHMYDALETAAAQGIIAESPENMDIPARVAAWRQLSSTLNELNRSVGHDDAYPFVISQLTAEKLAYVDKVVTRLQTLG